MFEVGFTEIVLILGLALLVLGPEKLPGRAEKGGRWTGRARAMARQLRTQLEQEVNLEEMTRARPMQAPPPQTETATPPNTTDASATTQAESAPATDPTASTEPPAAVPPQNAQPHNTGGLDLQTMVSGMEPPPQSAPETPTDKTVRDSAAQ